MEHRDKKKNIAENTECWQLLSTWTTEIGKFFGEEWYDFD